MSTSDNGTSGTPPATGAYCPPAGAWERRTPAEAGFDPVALASAIEYAGSAEIDWPRDLAERAPKGELHPNDRQLGPLKPRGGPAGVVVHGGYIVSEWGDPARVDVTFSATKSYISALAGLAIDRGLIHSVHDRVVEYVDDGGFESAHNASITWHHMLQQTCEWEGTLFGIPDTVDRGRVLASDTSAVAHEGADRALRKPGGYWEYNDVRVNRAALSVMRVWGEPLPHVLKRELMDPIGASPGWQWHGYDTSWVSLQDGTQAQSVSGGAHWGGGLWISALDHARFGLLFLRRGDWAGRRIVSESWADQMTTPCDIKPEYGYFWWLNHAGSMSKIGSERSFAARGAGGNVVFVEPELDVVIVTRWCGDTVGVVDRVLGAVS